MAEKIPFFTFFESFVPPRELRLLLHDARVVGGLLDRENRSMELELESGEEFSEAARSALEQLLQKEYDLRRLTLHIRSAAQAAAKVSNDVLFGKEIKGKGVSMEGLNPKMGNIVVEGKVFASECYETRRPGVWCLTFDMTDNCNSITVRKYLQDKESEKVRDAIKPGMWVRVQGFVELTRDGKDIQLNPQNIMKATHEGRKDTAPRKRVELHLHTRMSNMDALTDTKSVINLAKSWGHPAIAITDHGVAQAFPDAWHNNKGIKILYGMEGYFVNNMDDRIVVHGDADRAFSDEISLEFNVTILYSNFCKNSSFFSQNALFCKL